jgi:hypothetical protein
MMNKYQYANKVIKIDITNNYQEEARTQLAAVLCMGQCPWAYEIAKYGAMAYGSRNESTLLIAELPMNATPVRLTICPFEGSSS